MLLVGPPGTGKTLIARAVAGEAGVPFLSVSGSDFMEMFVGVGASRVRDLFQTARKLGRAIIFVDEIDSIGRKRGAGLGGGHDEREQTLNQMLSEMDGFEATEGIVMMAATNRPDILDPALLRPGRFDRQVVVPLPELEERLAILKVHTKGKRIAPDVDLDVVARGTPGMTGADLSNLVNEAALFAVRAGQDEIQAADFEQARDRVLMGARRESMALSDPEKELTAYHEAGHAVCAAVLAHADPLHKVTILPIGMALGVTQQLPAERPPQLRPGLPRGQPRASPWAAAGRGPRVRRHVDRRPTTTWSARTELARKMVREWGMSDAHRPDGVGLERRRCSSARTSCTPATTPTRPPGSSTRRSRRSCASRRSAAADAARAPQRPRPRRPVAARARDDRRRRGQAPHQAGRRHGRAQRRPQRRRAARRRHRAGPRPRRPGHHAERRSHRLAAAARAADLTAVAG